MVGLGRAGAADAHFDPRVVDRQAGTVPHADDDGTHPGLGVEAFRLYPPARLAFTVRARQCGRYGTGRIFAVWHHASESAVHRLPVAAQPPRPQRDRQSGVRHVQQAGVEKNQPDEKADQELGRPVQAFVAFPELGDGVQHQRGRQENGNVDRGDVQAGPAADDEDEVGGERHQSRQQGPQHGGQIAHPAPQRVQDEARPETAEQGDEGVVHDV